MKNKGFTLIELLGVIIVLGILVTIVGVTITKVLNDSETKLTEIQIEKLKDAAKNYYINEGMNSIDFEQDSFSHCVSVNYLIKSGYIDENEISNFETGEDMLGSIRINYDNKKYEYVYNEENCQICKLVTSDTKTVGNTPSGKYEKGEEYICEVKNNTKYHFFVIGTEGDNVNLIMDRNIYYDSTNDVGEVATETNKGLVAWNENSEVNSYGPVTAMAYLHNATRDWNNVPNMIMNYEDENINYTTQKKGTTGYGSIKTTGNTTIITSKSAVETLRIENLKTRMPRYDEVHGQGKCLTYDENGNKYGSCPLWLSNYLTTTSYVTGEGLQNISGIDGYWILSSYAGASSNAWYVYYDGSMSSNYVYVDFAGGVRPVISLPKNRFEDGNW